LLRDAHAMVAGGYRTLLRHRRSQGSRTRRPENDQQWTPNIAVAWIAGHLRMRCPPFANRWRTTPTAQRFSQNSFHPPRTHLCC